MIKVGIAGIGFMGWIHWLSYQKIKGVEVVAICESNAARRQGDWTGIKGNFGPPGTQVDLSNVQVFDNLETFCEADLDLVDICLPPAMHEPAINIAAKSGKHVFCEKPLALNADACNSAVKSCKDAQRNLYIGHVLPFFPEYQAAREIIASGKYGKLNSGYFKRVISEPTWLPDFFNAEKIGGPLLDLHVHDAHFIRLMFGMPNGVYSRGSTTGGVVRYCHSIFDFEDPELVVASTTGVIDQQGRPFNHGYEIHLEKATLQFEYAALTSDDELMPLKILTEDGQVEPIPISSSDPVDAFVAEIREVVDCVRSTKTSTVLDGQLAMDAVNVCLAESESVIQRKRIDVNEFT